MSLTMKKCHGVLTNDRFSFSCVLKCIKCFRDIEVKMLSFKEKICSNIRI